MSYTVTEKGTVTIPASIRRKYSLKKGSQVKFVETGHGVLLVPAPPLEKLYGADRNRKQTVYAIIRELEAERRREARGN